MWQQLVLQYFADAEEKSEERKAEDGQPLVARWSKPSSSKSQAIGSDSEGDEVVYSYNVHWTPLPGDSQWPADSQLIQLYTYMKSS